MVPQRPILSIENLFSYEKDKDFRKFFYIACEGHKTEKKYFDKLKSNVTKVHPFEIVTRKANEKGNSAPIHVLKSIIDKKRTLEYRSIDSFWTVIDNEWGDLDPIMEKFDSSGINLIISSPCFEVWILLHYLESLTEIEFGEKETCDSIITILKRYDPQYKKKRPIDNPMRSLKKATALAEEQHLRHLNSNSNEVWTTMYKLIHEILK